MCPIWAPDNPTASEVRNTSDYRLLDGPGFFVNVELATNIGMNEAALLQQIHYWCCISADHDSNFKDGHYWVYKTYEEWAKELLWKSPTTAKEAIKELLRRGLIITGRYSYGNKNRTTWYRVDYDKVAELTSSFQSAKMIPPPSKMTRSSDRNCPNDRPETVRTKTYSTAENTHIDGDLPLTEYPTTVESRVCEEIENDNLIENINLDSFIEWYFYNYASTFGKNHPPLTANQRIKVITALTDFLSNPDHAGIDTDGLQEMACDFFDNTQSDNWHIFHFVHPEILKYRYLNVYCH